LCKKLELNLLAQYISSILIIDRVKAAGKQA
jgi:hypothetical protein